MRVLFFLLIGIFISAPTLAGPVVAFSNVPPPGSYKTGGTLIAGDYWKALLFTTPPSSRTEIVSIKVGLTDCQTTCGHTLPETYPVDVDFQLSLYSVSDQAGVATPDAELYSIPMQYGLTLTQRGTEFTFNIPNWPLAANTTYALVAKGTNSRPLKWSNIELGTNPIYPPQAQNGFSFNSSEAFLTDLQNPDPFWRTAGLATNNSVEMQVLFVPSLSLTNSPQTYTGSAIAATVTCSSEGAVSNVKYNGSSTVPTAAGTYAVTANCAANGNYSALTDVSAGNLVISTAAPTLSVTNSPQTYTGSAIAATVSCSSEGAVSNVKYNGSSTVPTAAGTYAVTANCAANGNYSALTDVSAGNLVINPSGSTPGGTVSASITGGDFVPASAQFTSPSNPPPGQRFPYDVFGFTAITSVGGSVTVTLTYPQALQDGTKVWKDLNGTWLDWTSNVTINENIIAYTITDGGPGDADGLVNGSITDPLGPAVPSNVPSPIPTLSEWAQIMMMLAMIATAGFYGWRMKQR